MINGQKNGSQAGRTTIGKTVAGEGWDWRERAMTAIGTSFSFITRNSSNQNSFNGNVANNEDDTNDVKHQVLHSLRSAFRHTFNRNGGKYIRSE